MKIPIAPKRILVRLALLLLTVALVSGESGKANRYLYAHHELNGDGHVTEYLAPESRAAKKSDKPRFLYQEQNQQYRIVVFYIDWCNECKRFVPEYISFAKRIKELGVKHNTHIDVHSVSCMANRYVCMRENVLGYPMIRLYLPGQRNGIDLSTAELHPRKVMKHFGIQLKEGEAEEALPIMTKSIYKRSIDYISPWLIFLQTESDKDKPTDQQRFDDLRNDVHLSFDYAMRNSVFMTNDPLSDEVKTALFEWIQLLRTTIPMSWTVMHELLSDMTAQFRFVTKSQDYLESFLDRYQPEKSEWSGNCSHGVPGAGFSCGIWQMFHVVTVGVVDHNEMAAEGKQFPTEVVARNVRDFVKNFFPCQKCRENFERNFEQCGQNRCHRLSMAASNEQRDWLELPLWMFELHNTVNIELLRDRARRENRLPTQSEEINSLWPARHICDRCWRYAGHWRNDAVMTFLTLEYGERHSNEAEIRRQLSLPSVELMTPTSWIVELHRIRNTSLVFVLGFFGGYVVRQLTKVK